MVSEVSSTHASCGRMCASVMAFVRWLAAARTVKLRPKLKFVGGARPDDRTTKTGARATGSSWSAQRPASGGKVDDDDDE